MKLAKAIEIGTLLFQGDHPKRTLDEMDAMKLLIEAGKEISHFRSLYMPGICPKLPSETEE